MPQVLNKHRDKIRPDAVYIGRGSPYGNPYRIGVDGNRSEVIALFAENVLPKLDCEPLRGKDIWCFCAPRACHGDSILKKANS